ncbi:MAG TPA: ABC transporter ATP-binding protein [Spirochaetia bacterium]|nr:ABC transporter ATP-binding protein [Spirochaetia bacterium]
MSSAANPRAVAVSVHALTKRFGSFAAVDSVSFEVPAGSIFGLLGANGAGKSTTIRMLCGLLAVTSGTAEVAGIDVGRNPEGVKRRIGYMSQRFSLYDDLTVEENITFFGGVYGLSDRELAERREETVRLAGLQGRERALTRELSGGWKQRLALGCAMLHRPGIVFLDEPTGGTDPISRRQFWDVINGLAHAGTTVLVTTHYLDEAEYCNELVLMHAGRIVAQGTPGELKAQVITGPVFEVECPDPVAAMETLKVVPSVRETAIFGTRLHVSVDREDDIGPALDALAAGGLPPAGHRKVMPSLEDVFIRLIDRSVEAGN